MELGILIGGTRHPSDAEEHFAELIGCGCGGSYRISQPYRHRGFAPDLESSGCCRRFNPCTRKTLRQAGSAELSGTTSGTWETASSIDAFASRGRLRANTVQTHTPIHDGT